MPSTGQAEAIAACLRQGRLFYEAALRAPLEIRPLELYYGTSAYAKGLVLATNRQQRLNTLQQAHGVKDRSPHDARLGQLIVAIEQRGTFQEFNDCVRTLNRVQPLSLNGTRQQFTYTLVESASLDGVTVSLKEIFSRLPGLEALYRATFDERENIDFVQIVGPEEGFGWTVRVRSAPWGDDFEQCMTRIEETRNRMPFLRRWTFSEASGMGGPSLIFRNAEPLENELDRNVIKWHLDGFAANPPPFVRYFRDIEASLGPVLAAPGLAGGYYMQPLAGHFVSFQSLQFLALHLLSSLVRYRPVTWMHALSRSANNGRAADDAMLALIESFMAKVQLSMPTFVANVISPGMSF